MEMEKVALLCKEVMTELFPEEMPDYELGFYERYGGVYCTIQYSAEGHKKDGGLREYLDREFIEKKEESEPSGVGRV